jgi:hypothetical protein
VADDDIEYRPTVQWHPFERGGPDPEGRSSLLGRLDLGSVPFYVFAIEVYDAVGPTGVQRPLDPEAESLDQMWHALGVDEPRRTVAIEGRTYIVFMYPYML